MRRLKCHINLNLNLNLIAIIVVSLILIAILIQVAQNRQNGRTVSGLRPESHPRGLDGSEGGKHRYQNFPPPLSSMGTSTIAPLSSMATSTSLATDPGTLQPEDVYAGSSLYSSRVDLPHHSFSPSPRLEHRMSLQRYLSIHPDIHPIHPRNIEKHPCSGSPQRQKTTSTSGWGATSMGPLQRRTSEQQCSTVITRCEGDDHKHMIVDACEDDDHKHRMFDCRCLQIR